MERIDKLLVKLGFADSIKMAQALVIAGDVLVNEQKVANSSVKFKETDKIRVKSKSPYVSRAAYKLKTALDNFKLDVTNYNCVDIGSSTGGFTDLLLQNGASFVYAIDVGTNQLAYKLRTNKKVKSLEKTNARYFDFMKLENIDLYTGDLSFISLKLILKQFIPAMKPKSKALMLIKPQFEVSKDIADKYNGIIKDKLIHNDVISDIKSFLNDYSIKIIDVIPSVLAGTHGNQEYIIYFIKNE